MSKLDDTLSGKLWLMIDQMRLDHRKDSRKPMPNRVIVGSDNYKKLRLELPHTHTDKIFFGPVTIKEHAYLDSNQIVIMDCDDNIMESFRYESLS